MRGQHRTRARFSHFRFWVSGLLVVMFAGLGAAMLVFSRGLVVTNLSDLVPWGLWITIDLSAIALSAGAFTLCAAVYLLGMREYRPLARTATFIGIIGYSMAMLCLLVDIGRPERFWHAFVFWNPHSVLWEVTMCVVLYFIVLVFESMPILGGAPWFVSRWPRLAGWMQRVHHYAPYLAVAGVFLSMLHQSSLGATYGVLKARPLWYSPGLSVLFMLSAMVSGLSLTIFAVMLVERLTSRTRINDRLLDGLAYSVGWALVVYVYFRFWYTFSMTYTYAPGKTEGLNLLTAGPLAVNFWLGEILLGALVPMVILLKRDWRQNQLLRLLATGLVVAGLVAYRWDINLSGQLILVTTLSGGVRTFYTHYTPSLAEWLVGAGVIAYGLLAFSLGVRYLNVVRTDVGDEVHPIAARPSGAEQAA